MVLEFDVDVPTDAKPGAPVIVLLHGRGSNRSDLQGLRRGLPKDLIVVTPEAPFPAAPWGYGAGSAWYRYLGEDRPDPTTFAQSQDLLSEFLDGLPANLPIETGPLILGGFSQGGTMSLGHALWEPGKIEHVINFSGFLAVHPRVSVTAESVRGVRIFWGHGFDDPAIPFPMAERGRAKLREVGADLEARDYPIGHWIDAGELVHASAWIEAGLNRRVPDAAEGGAS